MGNNSNRRNSNNRGFLKSLTKGLRKMSNKVSNSAKNVRSRVSKRAKNVRSRARNGMKNVTNRVSRKGNGRNNRRNNRNGSKRNRRNGRNGRNSRRNNRGNMSGGAIEYSPLPCDANGNTDFDSTLQVGHETCVEYGTHGAENDSRAAGLGAGKLSDMKITETIEKVVDTELKRIMDGLDGQSNDAVRKALQDRLAAQNQTTAVSQ